AQRPCRAPSAQFVRRHGQPPVLSSRITGASDTAHALQWTQLGISFPARALVTRRVLERTRAPHAHARDAWTPMDTKRRLIMNSIVQSSRTILVSSIVAAVLVACGSEVSGPPGEGRTGTQESADTRSAGPGCACDLGGGMVIVTANGA